MGWAGRKEREGMIQEREEEMRGGKGKRRDTFSLNNEKDGIVTIGVGNAG